VHLKGLSGRQPRVCGNLAQRIRRALFHVVCHKDRGHLLHEQRRDGKACRNRLGVRVTEQRLDKDRERHIAQALCELCR
jgi:hypothetical protein